MRVDGKVEEMWVRGCGWECGDEGGSGEWGY